MQVERVVISGLSTNCWLLISDKKRCAVVDPGGDSDKIIAKIKELGVTPAFILLTHGHHDHIGGIVGLRGEWAGLKLYVSAPDAPMLDDVSLNLARPWNGPEENYCGIAVDYTLEDGAKIELDELGITTIATPGHTAGGLCFLCGDMLFTGDTLFCRNIGRTDLPSGSFDEIVASIKKLYALPGDYNVLPGHGPASKLDEERADNPYVRVK